MEPFDLIPKRKYNYCDESFTPIYLLSIHVID